MNFISGQTPGAAVSLTKAASRARVRPKAAGCDLTIELVLPFPVSANRLWARTKRGMRKSTEYLVWVAEAQNAVRKQKSYTQIKGAYRLSIQAVRPDKRRRDIDNTIKAVSDFLQHMGIVENDCYCEMVSARWVTTGEGITVRIEQAGTE